jgi:U3 small nucleolar RNA-associated protein 7
MTQNKSNAIIAMGTSKGVVEWWTPGIGTPAVQLFVGSKVDGIAFHKGYMYTIADSLKVWDSRMLKLVVEQPLNRRAQGISTSDSGLLAVNHGFKVDFFKDVHVEKQTHPYLRHDCAGKHTVNNLEFVPFEDLVGFGTNKGFTGIVVPGSGVPCYDSFENNPFETHKQKREALVHKLLEKLPP